MRNFKKRIPGIVISVILVAVAAVFIFVLSNSQMLPAKYLVLGSTALGLMVLSAILFVRSTAYKLQFVFGTVMAVALTAVMGVGSVYLNMTMSTLNQMTEVTTLETPVGIYVRAEDPAVSVDDAKNYSFGILSTMDRENTDKTIEALNNRFGAAIATKEYDGLVQVMDALLNGETEAMILNMAYIDMFEGMEGYEGISSRIHELEVVTVETVIEVPVEKEEPAKKNEEPHIFSVYIGGSDSRGALSLQARNDVNIIATVNTETKQVLLISTPRDYFVPLSISNGIRDKLTHAGIYGINVSLETMEMLYETDIDYYFRINFVGVEKIVDAMGGITVYNQSAFTSFTDDYFPQGEITLNGEMALVYARDRRNSGGDAARGRRQMEIIEGAIDKAMSPGILMRYTDILDSVSECIDMSVPYEEIATLVRQQLENNTGWDIHRYSVTGYGDSQQPYSMATPAYVMWPDQESVDHGKKLIQMVKDGEIITDADLSPAQ